MSDLLGTKKKKDTKVHSKVIIQTVDHLQLKSLPKTAGKAKKEDILTPAYQDVSPEVLFLRKERDGQQRVKIKAFHQQPEETGHDKILEEHHHYFAANLQINTGHKEHKSHMDLVRLYIMWIYIEQEQY